MAEHPNVELLRRGYDAYSCGNMQTLTELFSQDIRWHVPGRSPLAGDYEGRDAVFGFFGKVMELSGGSARLDDVHDIIANDDHAVGLVSFTATRGERTHTSKQVHVFHIRDGKATEFWGSSEDPYGDDEFWSS